MDRPGADEEAPKDPGAHHTLQSFSEKDFEGNLLFPFLHVSKSSVSQCRRSDPVNSNYCIYHTVIYSYRSSLSTLEECQKSAFADFRVSRSCAKSASLIVVALLKANVGGFSSSSPSRYVTSGSFSVAHQESVMTLIKSIEKQRDAFPPSFSHVTEITPRL